MTRDRYRVTANSSRRWYEKRRRLGECVRCSVKLPNGHPWVRCSECQASERTRLELRRMEMDDLDTEAADVPRCKCGLALPCNDCLHGIEFYASKRPGGATYPAPGWVTLNVQERRKIARAGQSKFSPRATQIRDSHAARSERSERVAKESSAVASPGGPHG